MLLLSCRLEEKSCFSSVPSRQQAERLQKLEELMHGSASVPSTRPASPSVHSVHLHPASSSSPRPCPNSIEISGSLEETATQLRVHKRHPSTREGTERPLSAHETSEAKETVDLSVSISIVTRHPEELSVLNLTHLCSF
ncbi:hypothetical protein EYF80_009205 [Liparis tanakae]|uniref:Uncharacterized protein n=1 Tax=Liparis tanakae TaxID=230148 RepID=A0A4Z2IRN7_9TELE|nr:hypothetical protein EYF80_009205 [Liparis tanakae]